MCRLDNGICRKLNEFSNYEEQNLIHFMISVDNEEKDTYLCI